MLKKILLFLIVSISLLFAFNFKKPGGGSILYGDALGYYMYLPAAFIYHNLDSITAFPEDAHIHPDIMWYANEMNGGGITPTGHVLDQYTFGMAFMEMPFFFAGHAYAKITGAPANGFSAPYQNAIRWSSVFYTFMGLLILYKVLRRYFTDNVSICTIAILFLGSNLFWFTLYQAGMSHVPLFFLFSLLLYLTIRLYESPTAIRFLLVGFVCGMITYIRPADIVCVFIPLLYNVTGKASWKDRIYFIKENKWKVLAAIFVCFLIWIPQMVYWKMMSGSFLYDSYGGKQTFNFNKPKIWEGLFSASNGWLFYSPALLMFFAGLFLWKKYRPFSMVVFIMMPVYLYVIYSWFVPNYINGLGSRPMVDVYAIVAFPVAAFIAYIFTARMWKRVLFTAIMLFCIAINFSFSIQEHRGVSRSEYNNSVFVRQMFFRYNLKYDDLVVNDIGEKQPDPAKLKPIGSKIYAPLSDTMKNVTKDSSGTFIYNVPPEEEITPLQMRITYHEKSMKNVHWIKGSGLFRTVDWADIWTCQAFVFTVERKTETIKWKGVRINNKIGRMHTNLAGSRIYEYKVNEWGEVSFYTALPDDIEEGDEIVMKITNSGKNTMQAKNVYIQMFE